MGRGHTESKRMPIIIPRLEDPGTTSAEERYEHLGLLEAARHSLDVEWTETLAAADAARDHHLMGHPSTVAYLEGRFGMARGRAHRYVRIARTAHRFVATLSAWKHRLITSDQADVLLRAAQKSPEDYEGAENVLLDIAGDTVDETKRVIEYWRNDVDIPGKRLEVEEQLRRRHFDVSRRPNGMVGGEFQLPMSAGETLFTALEALMPPPTTGDARTTGQRRADALEDLARSFLDGSETPVVGGERPHLVVHTDLDALGEHMGGLHETESGVVLDVDSLGTMICDSSVTRIVFGPESEVLDVGRKTRVIPSALRRAVVARDRSCTWHGCSRSQRWCDVHHIVSWADGGETVITNLRLLCRYHHTLTHLEIIPGEEGRGLVPAGSARPRTT
ncbi:MAG: DUF222 domain-containing protein [Acidimicrobiia bacterium]